MISTSSAYQAGLGQPAAVRVFAFEIEGYTRIFSNGNIGDSPVTTVPWILEGGIDDLQSTVNDLDGSVDLADLVVHVQDRGYLITADFPAFVFEGKKMYLKQGWGHLDPSSNLPVADTAYEDFVTLFTGKVDSVESENENQSYCFTCPDPRTELAQVVYGSGDDGFPTSSSHPRTLNGHPLDILLHALEFECGIDPADIDVAKITAYRDGIYSGAQMQFTLDSAPAAKDFLENEIMKPMGGYLWTNNLGQITVSFFYPLDITPIFNFNVDNLLEIPQAGQADLIDQVTTRLDADTQGNFLGESVRAYAPSIAKYGLYGEQIIESKGLRSGLNGVFLSTITAFLLFLRYGDKQLLHGDNGKNSASPPVNASWIAALLEPGDFVTMTHAKVPDRSTGTVGITDKGYVVLDRNWQFFAGEVQYKLLAVDLSKFRQYLITPDDEPDYTAASSADQQKYMFLCGDDDKYSNGDAGNTLC